MMNSKSYKVFMLFGILLLLSTNTIYSVEPPPKMISALIVQLIPLEKNLMEKEGDMSIHVVGSTALADALKEVIGWKIGKRVLGKVTVSDSLPSEKPDILCITDKKNLNEVLAYTSDEDVLSMTNNLDLVKKGISLGVDIDANGDPSIKLNLSSAKTENLNWNPAVFKIAKTIK